MAEDEPPTPDSRAATITQLLQRNALHPARWPASFARQPGTGKRCRWDRQRATDLLKAHLLWGWPKLCMAPSAGFPGQQLRRPGRKLRQLKRAFGSDDEQRGCRVPASATDKGTNRRRSAALASKEGVRTEFGQPGPAATAPLPESGRAPLPSSIAFKVDLSWPAGAGEHHHHPSWWIAQPSSRRHLRRALDLAVDSIPAARLVPQQLPSIYDGRKPLIVQRPPARHHAGHQLATPAHNRQPRWHETRCSATAGSDALQTGRCSARRLTDAFPYLGAHRGGARRGPQTGPSSSPCPTGWVLAGSGRAGTPALPT